MNNKKELTNCQAYLVRRGEYLVQTYYIAPASEKQVEKEHWSYRVDVLLQIGQRFLMNQPLVKVDDLKQAIALVSELNDSWRRIVEREEVEND